MRPVLAGNHRHATKNPTATGSISRVARAVFAAGVSLAALPACQPCSSCELSILTARLVSGTVTASANGGPDQQYVLSPSGGVSMPPGCSIDATTIVGPNNQPPAPNNGPVLTCMIDQMPLIISLPTLGDLRTLSAGLGKGMLQFYVDGFGANMCTTGSSSGNGSFNYDVTRADGQMASYPALVTSDYVRDVSVHFATTVSTSCGSSAISADLEFAQKASDAHQHSGCSCL